MTLRPLLLALAVTAAIAGCQALHRHRRHRHARRHAERAGQGRPAQQAVRRLLGSQPQAQPGAGHLPGRSALQRQLPDLRLRAVPRADASSSPATGWPRSKPSAPKASTGQDLLSYEIFVEDAKDTLESFQFPDWQMPINQMDSAAIAGGAARLGHRRAAVQDRQGLRQLAGARQHAAGAVRHRAIANMQRRRHRRRRAAARR